MRAAFKTLGCRLNQAETAHMAAAFQTAGYALVPFGQDCEVCVIHGCAVTANAERNSLRCARAQRRRYPHAVIVLAGCVGETPAGRAAGKSCADLVIGQKDKFDLPRLIARRFDLRAPCPGEPVVHPVFESTRALLRVQNGCDFGCAYCIVPHTRGPASSRPWADLLSEAADLAVRGYRELVLTGANLGCYRDGRRDLSDLLRALERIPDIRRLRISSIEPTTVEARLPDLFRGSVKLCRFLHLPVQSGDNGVLERMGRRYTIETYRAFVLDLVAAVPDIGLGTDIIAGFPGETREAFLNTVRLVRDLPFSNLHVFPYSPRPDTLAASLPNRVPAPVVTRRVRLLRKLGDAKRRAFAKRFLNRTVSVLIEASDGAGRGRGWTAEYLPARTPHVPARPNEIHSFVPTRIEHDCLC